MAVEGLKKAVFDGLVLARGCFTAMRDCLK